MMPNFRHFRFLLPAALAGLLLAALAASTPASAASGYGELLRFGGQTEIVGKKEVKREFELEGEEANAFGVDPANNEVYVGDEGKEEGSEELLIRRFSAAGSFEASATLTEPFVIKNLPPTGVNNSIEEYEGIAIDSVEHRLYVLVADKRFYEDTLDPSQSAAGTLYAFSTTANGSKELVAATGTNKGLLGSATTLESGSEVAGQALLNPTGITVDPATHEVLILGEKDEGVGGRHIAIDRVSKEGTLLGAYVDPNEEGLSSAGEPDSPVVSTGGKIFFEAGDELLELPSITSAAAPQPVFELVNAEASTPFHEEPVAFGENTATESGDGLAILPEAGGKGRLVLDAEVDAISSEGTPVNGEANPGVLVLDYSESGESVAVSEQGWSGGGPGEGPEAHEPANPCKIGYATGYPLVGAAAGGGIDVLSPSMKDVVEFGEPGLGCPAAKVAASGLEARVNNSKTTKVTTANTVTLLADVVQGNVLSVEWTFGDGETQTVEAPPSVEHEQTQTAETKHKFTKTGPLKVVAVIHTDDLQTPTITAEATITVSGSAEPIEITKQPVGQSLLEGETATFEASAVGSPKPTVQWELSIDGGKTFNPVAGAIEGKLTVPSTKATESGHVYRAAFTSGVETVATAGAVLSVESLAARHQKELEQQEKAKAQHEKEQREKEQGEAENKARELKEAQERAAKEAQERATKEAQEKAAKEAQEKGGVLGSRESSPLAKIASTSLTVSSSGAVTIKVSCPTGTTCTGTVTLKTLTAVSARASAAKAKKSILTLGTGAFTVAGGQSKTITLHLSATARKLLAHSHSLAARATVVAHNPSGTANTEQQTVTLRAAKAKAHH
jgi:hypothetical protein